MMNQALISAKIVFAISCVFSANLWAQSMACKSSPISEYDSGWCSFTSPIAFEKGDRLSLTVVGDATQVIVRLLPKDANPNTATGAISKPFAIPPNRKIELTIADKTLPITQISVHGGPNPWGLYPLSPNNKGATITGVERFSVQPVGAKR
jgi:hypothetical protein